MSNLLNETIKKLTLHCKSEDDILWVGTHNVKTTWDNFKAVADVEYDNGYGGTEVAKDLLIVGSDFWLERHEYDGAEWWEYKCIPKMPDKDIELTTVVRTDWMSELEEMNKV